MNRKLFPERLWAKATICPDSGCWLWTAAHSQDGYGLINIAGVLTLAHRAAWVVTNGAIPDGMHVLHRCDRPGCIRPDHLFLGTHADNMHDRDAKGRGHRSRFTLEQQRAIVAEWREGSATQGDVAARHGISRPRLSAWAHRD